MPTAAVGPWTKDFLNIISELPAGTLNESGQPLLRCEEAPETKTIQLPTHTHTHTPGTQAIAKGSAHFGATSPSTGGERQENPFVPCGLLPMVGSKGPLRAPSEYSMCGGPDSGISRHLRSCLQVFCLCPPCTPCGAALNPRRPLRWCACVSQCASTTGNPGVAGHTIRAGTVRCSNLLWVRDPNRSPICSKERRIARTGKNELLHRGVGGHYKIQKNSRPIF